MLPIAQDGDADWSQTATIDSDGDDHGGSRLYVIMHVPLTEDELAPQLADLGLAFATYLRPAQP